MTTDHAYGILKIEDLIPGDVLVSIFDPKCLPHWPVAIALSSPFVHTTIYIGDGQEVSADDKGIQSRPVTDANALVLRFTGDRGAACSAAGLARSYIGRPYNWYGASLLGVERLTNSRFPAWMRPKTKAKFCSEFCSDIWVLAGHDLLPFRENGETAPCDFIHSSDLMVIGFLRGAGGLPTPLP